MPPQSTRPRVCVIGAGASGLTTIKALKDRRIPVTCYERTPNVGGLWCIDNKRFGASAAYDSLHINSDTRMMEYKDFPMSDDLPAYPSHQQIYEYFKSYVDTFELAPHIHFNAEVSNCRRVGDGWSVVLENGESEDFDVLVVANGHHWDPQGPDPMPNGSFNGVQFHSHGYRNPTDPVDLRGKRVLVVGFGNSAVDIATELSNRSIAERVFLSVRSGTWVIPKWFAGKPITRLPITPWIPWQVISLVVEWAVRLQFGLPTDYGLPMPDHRPLESHPTISQDLLSRIGHGDIIVKPGISELHSHSISFENGTSEDIDAVIWCTGYKVSFPFFESSFLNVQDNMLPLWNRLVLPGVANLFFVGLLQPLGSVMQPAELQARIIGEHLAGRLAFPNESQMRQEIADDLEAMQRRYRSSRRHTMQVDFAPFMHRLNKLLSTADPNNTLRQSW